MTMIITVRNLVYFTGRGEAVCLPAAAEADPLVLRNAVAAAFSHLRDAFLVDSHSGPSKRYADEDVDLHGYLRLRDEWARERGVSPELQFDDFEL